MKKKLFINIFTKHHWNILIYVHNLCIGSLVLTFFLSFFLSFDHKIVWLKRYTINHDMFVPIERKEKDQPPSTKLTFSFLFFFFFCNRWCIPLSPFFSSTPSLFLLRVPLSLSLSLFFPSVSNSMCVCRIFTARSFLRYIYIYIYRLHVHHPHKVEYAQVYIRPTMVW